MSTIILVGIPLVIAAAVVLSYPNIPEIIKELVDILIRTTNYSTNKIVQIINYYIPVSF